MAWRDLGDEVVNPIGCQDCHDPATMRLRITRPALIEAFDRMGRNIERATHQEMRSLVCAQCHVEYFFRPEDNYLVFPWDDGITAEGQEQYLDRVGHTDWVHTISRAPMIKVQHPDWELYQTSIHAYRGVSCADCHMPYRREGGVKFTNHHIRSPLANVAESCMTCHGGTEEEMIRRVNDSQDKVYELRKQAERALAMLHIEAGAAWQAGATEAEMQPILQLIRQAQWRWDWIAASHGAAAHSPIESGRLLGNSISLAGEARLQLSASWAGSNVQQPVPMPAVEQGVAAGLYWTRHGPEPGAEGGIPRRHPARLVPVGGAHAARPHRLCAPRPHHARPRLTCDQPGTGGPAPPVPLLPP
jgi:nitrite reductase (cytochrome c-552)